MESNIVIIILLSFAFTIIGVKTQTLIPKSLFLVRPAGGMINFIEIPKNLSGLITSTCRLQIPSAPIAIIINLNEYLLQPYKLKSGEQIQKTSSDLCGIRMYPISEIMHESNLELIMEFNNGTTINFPFFIYVQDTIENISPVNISHSFTDYYYLPYTAKYYEYEDEFGIRDERVNMAFSDKTVNSNTWIGRGLVEYQMDEIKTVYNLIEDFSELKDSYTKLTIIESTQSHIFRCDLDFTFQTFSGVCYARKPDGTLIHIESGLSTNNYSTYDTQHLKGICSIEILKPFDEADRGIWKIFMTKSNSGCIFSVDGENEKTNRIKNILSTANSPIQLDVDLTNAGQTVTIECEYHEEIEFCILQNPTGDIEIKNNKNSATTLVLGYCSYVVEPIDGKWLCSIKVKDSEILKTIHYQMNTYNGSYIITKNTSDKKFLTESIELMCQTRFNYKLDNCLYESPSGVWYSLSEKSHNEITRISYAGRGLKYGDCGIEIINIQQQDFGNWTCHIKLHNSVSEANQFYHFKFLLVEDEIIGSAVILGVSIAFGIILFGLVMRYTYTRYRIRRNNSNNLNIEFSEN